MRIICSTCLAPTSPGFFQPVEEGRAVVVACSLDLIKEAKLGAEKEEFLNLMVKVDFCPKTWRSGQQEGIYTRNWGWTSVLRGSCSGSRRLTAPESFSG